MRDDLVVYVSDQAHSSLARAARMLGFRPDQVRVLPVDEQHRMRPDRCAGAIDADAAAGRRPLFVSVGAGSTNTGAIDPLPELAEICAAARRVAARRRGLRRLRGADRARARRALRGIELADSVTLDPHKWLYQPFECGCLLVREGERLRRAFEITPDYLADAEAEDERGQLRRPRHAAHAHAARALKVWMSVTLFGVAAFRAAIDASLDLAQLAEARVREHPELELLSPAHARDRLLPPALPRRRRRAQDAHNAALVRAFAASGRGLVSSTRLRRRYAIRLCALNHASTAADVEATLEWLATADAPPAPLGTARGIGRPGARQATMAEAESGVGVEPRALATVPLFAGLDALRLQVLAAGARAEARTRGEAVVRRFESGRDFYVILAGRAEVHVGDRVVRTLGPGEFFGELAALDWGADYGYPRLATVVAASDLRLARLTAATLRELMREVPAIDAAIRRAASERLAIS